MVLGGMVLKYTKQILFQSAAGAALRGHLALPWVLAHRCPSMLGFCVSGGLSGAEKTLKVPLRGGNEQELMCMCKPLCSQEGSKSRQVTFLQERVHGVRQLAWSPFRN